MKFNEWSKERIIHRNKRLTSRKTRTDPKDDPDIDWASDCPLPWGFIRDCLYEGEGAETPRELQEVIDKIFARRGHPVEDHEAFYVHVISDSCVGRLREEGEGQ